jgi:hypothetical protein
VSVPHVSTYFSVVSVAAAFSPSHFADGFIKWTKKLLGPQMEDGCAYGPAQYNATIEMASC